jgi:hypothetical protein
MNSKVLTMLGSLMIITFKLCLFLLNKDYIGCLWKLCIWDVDVNKLKQSHSAYKIKQAHLATIPPYTESETFVNLKKKILSKSLKQGSASEFQFVFLPPKRILLQ